MPVSRLVRLAPLTGVAFTVLALAGALTMGESPDFVAPPADFADWYTEDYERILFGSLLMLLSVLFLLWFVGTLAARLATAEGGDARVAGIGRGGGFVGCALLLASFSCNMVAALRVDDQEAISDDMAGVYGDLGNALGFIAANVGFAVLLAAVALLGVRTRVVPTWLVWVSGLWALGLVIGPIGWAFMIAFPLWVLAVSILLYVRQPRAAESAA